MPLSNVGTKLLALLMLLVGGGALFACLIFPAWLEYRAAQEALAAAHRQLAELEDELTQLAKQIEHLQSDPAYVERLARQEFGIQTPGVERIWIDASDDVVPEPTGAHAARDVDSGDSLPESLARATHANPLVAVFVLDETRPIVLALSAGMVLVALILLSRGRIWYRASA